MLATKSWAWKLRLLSLPSKSTYVLPLTWPEAWLQRSRILLSTPPLTTITPTLARPTVILRDKSHLSTTVSQKISRTPVASSLRLLTYPTRQRTRALYSSEAYGLALLTTWLLAVSSLLGMFASTDAQDLQGWIWWKSFANQRINQLSHRKQPNQWWATLSFRLNLPSACLKSDYSILFSSKKLNKKGFCYLN